MKVTAKPNCQEKATSHKTLIVKIAQGQRQQVLHNSKSSSSPTLIKIQKVMTMPATKARNAMQRVLMDENDAELQGSSATWPRSAQVEVRKRGGIHQFQLDCPSPIEPMLVNAWNHRSQVKGCGMLPLEPVNTHTPHVYQKPLHAQYIKCVTYSRYQQVHTHAHTTQSTLTCTIHKHATYSRYNTHTQVRVTAQNVQSEVPQLNKVPSKKGSNK